MNDSERHVLRSIRRSGLIVPGDRVGVAVSGGADSVALLHLLSAFRAALGVTICVVHFDHRLRDAESLADAQFVAGLSNDLGLEFFVESADVRETARRHKWNLEDAARRLRYAFFERLVQEGRVCSVAVAHTMDDQAETVLARLFRGCGPSGLASMHPRVGSIIRPLLEVRRRELRSYLRNLGQSWREDSTNTDLSRQRARIRNKLMPALESEFSPSLVENLSRLARLSQQDEDFWTVFIETRLRELAEISESALSISSGALLSPFAGLSSKELRLGASRERPLPYPALTQRLIRQCFSRVRSRGEISASHVEQVIRLAASQSGRRVELPGGISVHNRLGNIIFERQKKLAASRALETGGGRLAFHYRVALPQRGDVVVSVPEVHTSFRLKLIDWPCSERETRSEQGVLDVARLRPPLLLRSWRPGDAYRPCTHRRTRKLKRMLLEARVPREQRLEWPILESSGKIVWARHMPLAEGFAAGKGTKVALVIEEEEGSV